MKQHQFLFWSDGGPLDSAEGKAFAQRLPRLPPPAHLREIAVIAYQWGETKFEIAAVSCSLRLLPWARETLTWLHCKAAQTVSIKEGTPAALMTVLIPARYVTSATASRVIRLDAMKDADGAIGVFAPTHPAPPAALALAEIEVFLAKLLAEPGTREPSKESR